YGDGSQTRSFCYVDDLVGGLMRLMDTGPEVTGPINLGNPAEFSMLQLAEFVVGKVGGSASFDFHPLPLDDPKQRQPDITLAREVLGWKPQIALSDGLDSTIAYFRGQSNEG
ncbi:MAG: SDR family NAD-dependent epimerase/dehydratase, partial [Sphingomonas sp.]|nr:SDR family NAD-dependent epimerase/dehydratase [Sphingomonas sp.]